MKLPLEYDNEINLIKDSEGRSVADLYNEEFANVIIDSVNNYEDLKDRLEITRLHKEDIRKSYKEKMEENNELKYKIHELVNYIKYDIEINKRNNKDIIAQNSELLLERLGLS